MSYRDVMDMPLRTFWSFNANVVRLRAEESLHAMELYMLGSFGISAESVTALRERFTQQMKEPIKAEQKFVQTTPEENLALHKEGTAKLREILSRK